MIGIEEEETLVSSEIRVSKGGRRRARNRALENPLMPIENEYIRQQENKKQKKFRDLKSQKRRRSNVENAKESFGERNEDSRERYEDFKTADGSPKKLGVGI